MAVRVTEAEVKALIDTERSMTPFIESATLMVDETLTDKGLSTGRLKQIELYLAAHFCAITEEKGGLIVSKVGDAVERYTEEYGQGLALTRFGQQAILLDTSGTLGVASTSNPLAVFRVV